MSKSQKRRHKKNQNLADSVQQRIQSVVLAQAKDADVVGRLLENPVMPIEFLTNVHMDVVGKLLANGSTPKAVLEAAAILWRRMPTKIEPVLASMVEIWNTCIDKEFETGVRPEELRKFFDGYTDENGLVIEGKRLEFSSDPTFAVLILERFGFLDPDRTRMGASEDRISFSGALPKYGTIVDTVGYDGHVPDPMQTHQRKMVSLSKKIITRKGSLRPFLNSITYVGNDRPTERYRVHPSALSAVLHGAYNDKLLLDWTPDTIVQFVSRVLLKMCDDLLFGNKPDYKVHIGPYVTVKHGVPEITHSSHILIPSPGGTFYLQFSGWVMDEELGLGVANIMSELDKVQAKLCDTWFKLEPFESGGVMYVRVPMCLNGSQPRNMININNEEVKVTVKLQHVRAQGTYYAWHYPGSDRYKPVTYLIHDLAGECTFWYIPWRGKPVQERNILTKLISKMCEFTQGHNCVFEIAPLPPIVGSKPTPDSWAVLKTADYGESESGISLYQTLLPRKKKGERPTVTVNMTKWGLPIIAQEPVYDHRGNPAYAYTVNDLLVMGGSILKPGEYVFVGSARAADKLAIKLGASLYVTTRVIGSHVKLDKLAYKMRSFGSASWLCNNDVLFADDKVDIPFTEGVAKVFNEGGHVECMIPRLEDGSVDKEAVLRAALSVRVVCNGYVVIV